MHNLRKVDVVLCICYTVNSISVFTDFSFSLNDVNTSPCFDLSLQLYCHQTYVYVAYRLSHYQMNFGPSAFCVYP